MALILCPECGKEVSDTTKTCVHCGYVFKTSKKEKNFKELLSNKKVLVIGLVVVVAAVLLIFTKRNPFKGLNEYPSGEEVHRALGHPDEEKSNYGRPIEKYYKKICGYSGEFEIKYESKDKTVATDIVWRYDYKDNYTYEDEEKCIKKLTKFFNGIYKTVDGTYMAKEVWEDAHGNRYALQEDYDGVYIEFWN